VKVCLSYVGRSHGFDLARQLEVRGSLERLYTCYPVFKVDTSLRERTSTFPWLLTPAMAAERIGLVGLTQILQWPITIAFDRWVERHLKPCDVVVALHSFGLETFRRARQFGVKTICDQSSVHIKYQDEQLSEEHRRWRLPYRPIHPKIVDKVVQEYEEADLITIPSENVRRSFSAAGGPTKKLRKLIYGVDISLFKPVAKKDDVFRVLYAGSVSLSKGVLYLLQAMSRLRLPNFEVVLIGGISPEIRPFLSEFEDTFKYAGFIQRADLYQYLSQGSVLIQPSIQEGLSLILAQAMACGLPIIATDHTGAEDLITDGKEGFIVPIRDPQAIRERVLYLYENVELRGTMAFNALQRVRSLGGWDFYGSEAVRIYGELLKE